MRKLILAVSTTVATFAGLISVASPAPQQAAHIFFPLGSAGGPSMEFLVTYRAGTSGRQAVFDAIARHGGEARAFNNFPVIAAEGTSEAILATARVEGVTAIEANTPITFFDVAPSHAIGADTARAAAPDGLGVNGSGVTVGIIDSGADGTHPDLRNRLNRNVKVAASGVVVDMKDKNGDTSSGHGSHVAGIVAGEGTASGGLYTGVAPGAKIDSVGVGDGANILWALDGFDYLLSHATEDNIVAINNSWGSSRQAPSSNTTPPAATNATRAAVTTAISRGISVVFAAGNDGTSADGGTDYCADSQPFSTINPYALIPGVVSAASSSREGNAASSFSSCGKGTSDRSHDPTITAPGGNIVSVRGTTAVYVDPLFGTQGASYAEASGTSMAAPHTAGAIALIQSARIGATLSLLSPSEIKSLLASTAAPIAGVAARKQGAGLIDVRLAVAQALSVTPPAALAGICPVISDLSGDATQALINTPTPSDPALDITTGSLTTSGSTLTLKFKVTNLDLNDLGTGQGGLYELIFFVGRTQYSITAQYRKANVGTASGVSIPWTSFAVNIFNPLRTAIVNGTGSFDPSTNTITANVPVSGGSGGTSFDFTGRSLDSMVVTTRRDYNRVVPNADSAYSTKAFVVGNSC